MKEILCFETVQCIVFVYDSEKQFAGRKLYVVQSHHKKTQEDNIRFGTKRQLINLLEQYKYSLVGYKNNYERFMTELKNSGQ